MTLKTQLFTLLLCLLMSAAGCSSSEAPSSEANGSAKKAAPTQKDAKKDDAKKDDAKKTKASPDKPATPKASHASGETPLPWGDDAKPGRRLEGCVAPTPDGRHLGLTEAELVTCLNTFISKLKLPKEAKKPLKKRMVKGMRVYEIPKFLSVALVEDDKDGKIAGIDVFFFNDLREEHGMKVELFAQYAVLATMVPAAEGDMERGVQLFRSMDDRRLKAKSSQINSTWNKVAINASFMPISVRYQFRPAS